MQTVLFHRRFRNFTGGHLKVWHYYQHVRASTGYRPRIYLSAQSRPHESNPWNASREDHLTEWKPEEADLLFLGGQDWNMVPREQQSHYVRPVLNLVQHVRHADPAHPSFAYLKNRAIRICVSEEVRTAIEATGQVNGPVAVIPNGLDLAGTGIVPRGERPLDWLVCGMKHGQAETAAEVGRRLANETAAPGLVEVLVKLLPRKEFLAKLAGARRAVFLPRQTEGFYLPALEGMALGTIVVCPDCIGNRSFCQDGRTALVSDGRQVDDLMRAAHRAVALTPAEATGLLERAHAMAARHSLAQERAAFHELLANVPSLW